MRFQKLRDTVQLTSLIFTGIVVLDTAAGQTFSNEMAWGILICSLLAALLKFRIFKKSLFDSPILLQTAYLILVWLLFLLCSFFFNRGLSWVMALSILAEVLLIYFAIRLVNYQLVKMEVKRMNKRLGKREEKEKEKK